MRICPKNCPERSVTCHSTCEKYLKHWEASQKRYEKRVKEQSIDNHTQESIRRKTHMKPVILDYKDRGNKNK